MGGLGGDKKTKTPETHFGNTLYEGLVCKAL